MDFAERPLFQKTPFPNPILEPWPDWAWEYHEPGPRLSRETLTLLKAVFKGAQTLTRVHWNFRGWKCLIHGTAFSPSLIHGLCGFCASNSQLMRLFRLLLTPLSTAPSPPPSQFTVCTSRFARLRAFEGDDPCTFPLRCSDDVLDSLSNCCLHLLSNVSAKATVMKKVNKRQTRVFAMQSTCIFQTNWCGNNLCLLTTIILIMWSGINADTTAM